MTDTTATVRAEILEEAKRTIESEICALRDWKSCLEGYAEADPNNRTQVWKARIANVDAEIDRLLIEKDNLSADVPNGWIEDAEADALDYADLKATQESALGRGW